MPALQNGNWIEGNRMNTKLNHVQNWLKLAKRSKWSVSNMARACGISKRTLERHFRKEMNMPPKVWMAQERQRQALVFLRDGYSVKETATQLGFRHAHHFSCKFKEYWGACPTRFIRTPFEKEKCRIFV